MRTVPDGKATSVTPPEKTRGCNRVPTLTLMTHVVEPVRTEAEDDAARSSDGQALTIGQIAGELGLAEPGASADVRDVHTRLAELEKSGRVRVMCRPQLATLSNQSAQLMIGQKKPYVVSSSKMQFGTSNSISYRDVGLTLTVTPRAGADNVVTAEVQLTESRMDDAKEGAPVLVTNKETVRSPIFVSLDVQSVVRLRDGRTTILGGLATEGKSDQPGQLVLITANVVRD